MFFNLFPNLFYKSFSLAVSVVAARQLTKVKTVKTIAKGMKSGDIFSCCCPHSTQEEKWSEKFQKYNFQCHSCFSFLPNARNFFVPLSLSRWLLLSPFLPSPPCRISCQLSFTSLCAFCVCVYVCVCLYMLVYAYQHRLHHPMCSKLKKPIFFPIQRF